MGLCYLLFVDVCLMFVAVADYLLFIDLICVTCVCLRGCVVLVWLLALSVCLFMLVC